MEPNGWSVGVSTLGDLRVVHGRADLLADELGGDLVRLLVEQEVDEAAEKGDASDLPAPLELRLALLRRRIEEQLGVEHVGAAEAGLSGELTELAEVAVTPLLALVIDRAVVRGDAEVRCALEHGELRRPASAIWGIDWIADEPVPMIPTRKPVKSTPSWGH